MSSAFRVTQRSVTTTVMRGLQANSTRLQQIQEQLSSGRQVTMPKPTSPEAFAFSTTFVWQPESCSRSSVRLAVKS